MHGFVKKILLEMESKVVSINVGGTIFQTTEFTLSRSKLFQTLLEEGKDIPFLDRDPKYFALILNYLRGGLLVCSSHLSFTQLELEADYFGLPWNVENFGEGPDAKQKQLQHRQWMKGKPGEYRELISISPNTIVEFGHYPNWLWRYETLKNRFVFNNNVLPLEFQVEIDRNKATMRILDHYLKYGWEVQQSKLRIDADNRTTICLWRLRKS